MDPHKHKEGVQELRRMPLTTYGTPGAADIQGLVYYHRLGFGRFLAIEVKRPGERIEPGSPQANWRNMVTDQGGLHIEAHSVEDVRQVLQGEGFTV